jgi:hypothetical protein
MAKITAKSGFGTFRTSSDVRSMVAIRAKADLLRASTLTPAAPGVRCLPSRRLSLLTVTMVDAGVVVALRAACRRRDAGVLDAMMTR